MTDVSFFKCLLGSVVGLLPTTCLNTYMGCTVRNMQEVLSNRADGYIILTGQVIFSALLMLYIGQKARSELSKLAVKVDIESGNSS